MNNFQMAGRIKVALVGIGNCFSGLIQGIEYYRQNPSQEVTRIIFTTNFRKSCKI